MWPYTGRIRTRQSAVFARRISRAYACDTAYDRYINSAPSPTLGLFHRIAVRLSVPHPFRKERCTVQHSIAYDMSMCIVPFRRFTPFWQFRHSVDQKHSSKSSVGPRAILSSRINRGELIGKKNKFNRSDGQNKVKSTNDDKWYSTSFRNR